MPTNEETAAERAEAVRRVQADLKRLVQYMEVALPKTDLKAAKKALSSALDELEKLLPKYEKKTNLPRA